MSKIIKPSFIISTTAPLSPQQHYVYNRLLSEAYKQLETNYLLNIFTFDVYLMKKISNGRLDSINKVKDFFNEIYQKDFEANLLGKDKKIKRNIKTRLITTIDTDENGIIKLGLEPVLIEHLRMLIAKKQNLLPKDVKPEQIELNPYSIIENDFVKVMKFRPAQVIYELIYDYKNIPVPLIDINIFKKMTNTEEKYKTNYNNMVIKKSEKMIKDLLPEINCKVSLIKEGRTNKWIKITSELNKITKTFKSFYKDWLKKNQFEDNPINKKIAQKVYDNNKGEH